MVTQQRADGWLMRADMPAVWVPRSMVGRCEISGTRVVRLGAVIIALIIAAVLPLAEARAGEAALSWDPVTANSDGSSLTNLAGYKVYYGTQSNNYSQIIDAGNVTAYVVSGLPTGATYFFAVTVYNTSGQESGHSNEVSKAFVATTPPVISAIAVGNISATSATIIWSTDEPATSQIEYGITTAYGTVTTRDPLLAINHSQTVSGLQPSTLYHYRIWSVDAAGNIAISGDNTFMTTAATDTTPPVISGVTAGTLTNTSAVITWTTDEAATSQVDYGLTTAYGNSTPLDPTLLTSHSQSVSGLLPGTFYHYRVRSIDGANNLAVSGDTILRTLKKHWKF